MNCTFYRPSTVNVREFENIVGKLAHDLHMLENEKQDEWSVYSYFYALSCCAEPLKKNINMKIMSGIEPVLIAGTSLASSDLYFDAIIIISYVI